MTPLVLVHGFLGGSDQWEAQAPLGTDRSLITVDLPGFGRNADLTPINSIEGFATWVLEELSQSGIESFDLLGHSMGGMIVQDMIRLAPERIEQLILYGTGPLGVLPGRFETIERSMERARNDGPKPTGRRISATWFRDGEKAAGYPACAKIAQQAGLPAILAGLEAMRDWSGESALADVKSPTLVLWGDKDRSYGWPQVEKLWKTIPDCNLAVVPNSAHAVHSEHPDVFNLLISRFLARR